MGAVDGRVVIFQGVQQDIGPIKLSHVYKTTTLDLDDLSPYYQQQVESTLNANSLAEAQGIVDRLSDARQR